MLVLIEDLKFILQFSIQGISILPKDVSYSEMICHVCAEENKVGSIWFWGFYDHFILLRTFSLKNK